MWPDDTDHCNTSVHALPGRPETGAALDGPGPTEAGAGAIAAADIFAYPRLADQLPALVGSRASDAGRFRAMRVWRANRSTGGTGPSGQCRLRLTWAFA